jgi:mono/diheme cytochrome c family protein
LNQYLRCFLAVGALAPGWTTAGSSGRAVDFASEVQPILTQHCLKCHGGIRRKAGVSFLSRDSALGQGKSGRSIIVPGEPTVSELLRRVASNDPDERMPPEGERLTDAEVMKLREWVSNGARWPDHWAFRPVRDPSPPSVIASERVRNPVDRFVVSAL